MSGNGTQKKDDPNFYENSNNSKLPKGIRAEDAKVTWWAFDAKGKQETVDENSKVLDEDGAIIIRICLEEQTVASTLFDRDDLKKRMMHEKFVICYHPYNFQAWRIDFEGFQNIPTKHIFFFYN